MTDQDQAPAPAQKPDFFELSTKWAQVFREHRLITRLACVLLIFYCTDQIAWSRAEWGALKDGLLACTNELEAGKFKFMIGEIKWYIGQQIAMLTAAFMAYAGTGNK